MRPEKLERREGPEAVEIWDGDPASRGEPRRLKRRRDTRVLGKKAMLERFGVCDW